MVGDCRVPTSAVAADIHTQEGTDQEFLEFGQPGNRQEDETKL